MMRDDIFVNYEYKGKVRVWDAWGDTADRCEYTCTEEEVLKGFWKEMDWDPDARDNIKVLEVIF